MTEIDLSRIAHRHDWCPQHGEWIHRWLGGFCPVPGCRWIPVFVDGRFIGWGNVGG